MAHQLSLVGVNHRTPHANRGRAFQQILNNTHLWYERQRWGRMFEIPNAFSFVSEREWHQAPEELRARTTRGAPLLRVKSGPDYLGGLLGLHVAFDAKEFSGPSISIDNFKAHQVDALFASERGGNLAGFMILEKRTGNVYWVSAHYTREWQDNVRMRKAVAKSLNFSKVEDPRIRLLCQLERDSMAHYAPALIPSFRERLIAPAEDRRGVSERWAG